MYFYGIDDQDYHIFGENHPEVTFSPFVDESLLTENSLVIIDDMHQMLTKSMNDFITNFITRSVHHNKISVLLVVHNLYSKNMRTCNLSTDYILLFNFPRDRSTVSQIAKQVCPGQNKFLREAYDLSTFNKLFGYLFLDLHQLQNPRLRFRSCIYNDDETLIFTPL